MDTSTFASKFLSRIGRIDRDQIEQFLQQLLKEKNLSRLIFDSLPDGLVLTDGSHRVVFINEGARALLGLGSADVAGERLRRLVRAKNLQAVCEEYEELGEAIEHRELRVRTPAVRVYGISALPLRDAHGRAAQNLWLISDRTDDLRRAAERHQAESVRSLATLTAGIAHEIKNPLNSLNIHAQLIQQSVRDLSVRTDGPDCTRLEKSAEVMLEEIARLTRIVDQFIKAARPARMDRRPMNLNEVVVAVAELLGPECAGRRIELTVNLDPLVPSILADPEQLRQALLNLAKNAMEAIDKPEGHIILRTALKSDHLALEVEDNGCGIAEEDRLRIFEPYHTTKFNGTGLGLMVVFRIISAHGGVIGLDSEVGRGTLFRVALPLDERPVRMIGETTSVAGEVRQLPA